MNLRYPWQGALYEAFSENDPEKLASALLEVETLLFERSLELFSSTGGHREQLAINLALESLIHLRTYVLGWPSISPAKPLRAVSNNERRTVGAA